MNKKTNKSSSISRSRKKKIWFVDFWNGYKMSNKSTDLLLSDNLLKRYDLELNQENPDILIYSVFGNNHQKYNPKVSILYSGENLHHYHNHYRYFDNKVNNLKDNEFAILNNYTNNENSFHLINCIRSLGFEFIKEKTSIDYRMSKLDNKSKFTYFMVRNGGVAYRNNFFELLNKIKKVDSMGSYKNNMDGYRVPFGNESFDILSKYKFGITFENSSSPGYITEKPFNAYMSGSIPIYHGDQKGIKDIFNTETMVNLHDYSSIDEVISKIIELDNDDELYKQYINKEIFKNNYLVKLETDFYNFMDNIFLNI